MTNTDLDRLLEIAIEVRRLENLLIGGCECEKCKEYKITVDKLVIEAKSLKSQIESKLAQADKWKNLIQAMQKSCGSEITVQELDAFITRIGRNANAEQELSQLRESNEDLIKLCEKNILELLTLRPLVQALRDFQIEINKLLQDMKIPEIQAVRVLLADRIESILTSSEGKP